MTHDRHPLPTRVSRRHLLAGAGATVAAGGLGASAAAQGATPAATPAAVDLETFRAVCIAVTGLDELDDDAGLTQLLGLFNADEEMTAGLQELIAAGVGAGDAEVDLRALPFSVLVVVTNILQFWYLGNFRNAPLDNRAERFAGLAAWQALPYATNQTVCKAPGYWAADPGLPDRKEERAKSNEA